MMTDKDPIITRQQEIIDIRWAIGSFEECGILRVFGPLWPLMVAPERLLGDYGNCWERFFISMEEDNTEASRRKWRKRGWRRVKVIVRLELADD